jgi:hypothetical protein
MRQASTGEEWSNPSCATQATGPSPRLPVVFIKALNERLSDRSSAVKGANEESILET